MKKKIEGIIDKIGKKAGLDFTPSKKIWEQMCEFKYKEAVKGLAELKATLNDGIKMQFICLGIMAIGMAIGMFIVTMVQFSLSGTYGLMAAMRNPLEFGGYMLDYAFSLVNGVVGIIFSAIIMLVFGMIGSFAIAAAMHFAATSLLGGKKDQFSNLYYAMASAGAPLAVLIGVTYAALSIIVCFALPLWWAAALYTLIIEVMMLKERYKLDTVKAILAFCAGMVVVAMAYAVYIAMFFALGAMKITQMFFS